MLGRLFGGGKVSPEKRSEILAYLRSEAKLDAMHREQGERYQRLVTPLAPNFAPGTDAARAMAEAASAFAAGAHQLVRQHAELLPSDEARDSHMACHLTYVALAEWLDARATLTNVRVPGANIYVQSKGLVPRATWAERPNRSPT